MKLLNLACLGVASLSLALRADAEYVPIYNGPAYDSASKTGYMNPSFWQYHGPVVANGIAIVGAGSYSNGVLNGSAAFRWGQAQALEELGNLGNSGTGSFSAHPTSINSSGMVSGFSNKYVNGVFKGERAVIWKSGSSAPIELPTLGTDSSGSTFNRAYAINDAGVAVGHGYNYLVPGDFGILGIRWSADQTPTRLGSLASIGDLSDSVAYAINEGGTAAGFSSKYVLGQKDWRATRWDAAGTAVTELENLGTSSAGRTESFAVGINKSNVVVGTAQKYESGVYKGRASVRWDASGTATELGNLGTLSSARLTASGINNSGVAAGMSRKYVEGVDLGMRAVRWNPDSIQAIELANLGTSTINFTSSSTSAINDAGIISGTADEYDSSGTLLGTRAVVWRDDGSPIVLNNLIDPTSGWVNLTSALGISNGNWVMGVGTFDADGAGSLEPYKRAFLLHVDLYTPGDTNGDGAVDSVDFTTLASKFGTLAAATWGMGDFDGDEKVTTSDFNRLAGHFGESATMTGTVVPEPTSLLLASIVFVQRGHRTSARTRKN